MILEWRATQTMLTTQQASMYIATTVRRTGAADVEAVRVTSGDTPAGVIPIAAPRLIIG